MVPAGSSVLVNVSGSVTDFTTEASMMSQISAALTSLGLLVTSISFSVPLIDASTMFSFSSNYVAAVTVKTQDDYSSPDDVGAVVSGAFATVTGNTPASVASSTTADTVPTMTPTSGIFGGLSTFASGLESDVRLGLVLAVVLIIALIWALGWSPNAPALVPRA